MARIHRLPEQLVNQIAAGEVIERPASVVKELVENALDAGSSRITVEIVKGGRDRIRVVDDGCGMEKEDLFMAFERHATSKIRTSDDLARIRTLGFRGEALPSIAAVSRLICSSAPHHGEGFSIQITGGTIQESKPVSRPQGTEAIVEDLFFNLPARRKFLKSDEREGAAIRELIQRFAMIHPSIAFFLSIDAHQTFSFPPSHDRKERVCTVWKAFPDDIAVVECARDIVRGHLILASPYRTYTGPSAVVVNSRLISDRRISAVILRLFRETLGGERRTPYLLSLTLPHEMIDVNVHPAKSEVRFRNEAVVFACVEELFLRAITTIRRQTEEKEEPKGATATELSSPLIYPLPQERPPRISERAAPYKAASPLPPRDSTPPEGFPATISLKGFRVVGTLFDTYIIVERGDTVYFIDQHASHERIIYTNLRRAMEHRSGLTQLTILPSAIRLSATEMALFKERKDLFSTLGFILEQLDEETLILRGVPALSIEADWPLLIKTILADISEQGFSTAWDEKFLSLVAMRACKSAVRAHQPLTHEEIVRLISEIDASEVLTCPHGRPFFIALRKGDFDRKVGR